MTESKKYVRVALVHEYIVPADNYHAIAYAKSCIYDDVVAGAINNPGMFDYYVSVTSAPEATENDVPDFICEYIGETDDELDDEELT
jgi:hypothetical protein